MSWVTVIWSMVASACLTLMGLHLLVWQKLRTAWGSPLFALLALANAAMAGCELWMLRTATAADFATALRWLHVPVLIVVVAVVGFVRLHLRAGRPWLAWAICCLRVLSLLLDFVTGQNLNYVEQRHRSIRFLGETVSIADGVPNPWTLIGQLSLFLLVVFVVDAAAAIWRRGDRRQALVLGGSIGFFVFSCTVQATLVAWGVVHMPLLLSLQFMVVVGAVAHELSVDVVRAARLAADLHESEARYRGIFEGALEGMFRTSLRGELLLANPALARMLGYSSAEDIVRGVRDTARQVWFSPEERTRLLELLKREGGVRVYECQFRRRDGSTIWVSLSCRAIRGADGHVACFDGFVEDITVRRHDEETLRTSQERLATGAELAGLGFYEVVGGDDASFVDARMRSLCGLPADAEQGRAAMEFWIEHIHPGDLPRMLEAHTRLNDGRLDRTAVEYRYLHPARGEIWIHHLAVVVRRDAARRATYTIGVVRDISEQKQAEAETSQVRGELAHFGRLAMMTQIASSLAHELSQPLGAILRNAEAAELLLEEPAPDLEEVRAILADIRADDQRAGEVIDRMRAMVKRGEVRRCPLDVGALAEETIALVRPDADRRGLRLALEVGSPLPFVQGDRVQLQQVVLNLLLNAMDALSEHPRAEGWVAVRVRSVKAALEVRVSDNGPGLPANGLVRVFEPFQTSKPNGLGMGLPISRGIVEAHGGELWAANDPGGGATFTFSLPVSEEGRGARDEGRGS